MDVKQTAGRRWGPSTGNGSTGIPRTRAEDAVNRLRRDIVSGRLQPGVRLYFEKISKTYGIGTSPLREALVQLAAEGLAVAEGQKGFTVAPVLYDEMMDVANLRIHLETMALAKSIACGDEDWEADIVAACHRLTKATVRLESVRGAEQTAAQDDWERRHRGFHFALTAACESLWLLHFCDRLYDQIERYRRHFWDYPHRADLADAEHRR